MNKKKFGSYNDGMLYLCRAKEKKTSFGAVKNVTSENDLEKIVKLAFEEKSVREEDEDFAKSKGRTLSMKVKTRLYPYVSTDMKVLIQSTLYSIIQKDRDKEKQELYIYLEEERKL